MDWVKPLEAWARQWWTYIDWCLEADMNAPICRPFWTWVVMGCGAVAALGIVFVAVRLVSYRVKLAVALRAEEERSRAR